MKSTGGKLLVFQSGILIGQLICMTGGMESSLFQLFFFYNFCQIICLFFFEMLVMAFLNQKLPDSSS